MWKIKAGHPALKRYRGSPPEYRGEDGPAFKALVAEIVADQAARMLMEKRFAFSSTEQLDAPRFYSEHYGYLSKYLVRCHRVLVGDLDAAPLG